MKKLLLGKTILLFFALFCLSVSGDDENTLYEKLLKIENKNKQKKLERQIQQNYEKYMKEAVKGTEGSISEIRKNLQNKEGYNHDHFHFLRSKEKQVIVGTFHSPIAPLGASKLHIYRIQFHSKKKGQPEYVKIPFGKKCKKVQGYPIRNMEFITLKQAGTGKKNRNDTYTPVQKDILLVEGHRTNATALSLWSIHKDEGKCLKAMDTTHGDLPYKSGEVHYENFMGFLFLTLSDWGPKIVDETISIKMFHLDSEGEIVERNSFPTRVKYRTKEE